MAGNLSGLHVFANDVSPEPLSLLDTNYSAINVALNALATFSNYYVDSGIANAMAIAVTANQTVAYSDGLLLQIQVAATNTGATTLNVAGIGPKNVVDQAGNALPSGMLLGGSYITVIYRATANNFQLLDGGQFPSASIISANPTGTVGLSAVNGVATTYMRSDAAPPLSQAISPTWSGNHTFQGTVLVNQASGLISVNSTTATNPSAVFFNLGGTNKTRIGSEGTAGGQVTGSSAGDTFILAASGQNILFSIAGAAAALKIGSAGTITIATPTGGIPLTINGTTGGGGFLLSTLTSNANTTADFSNLSTAAAATAQLRMINANDLVGIGITSTGFSGSFFSQAPTGEIGFLFTNANIPLVFGTNASARMQLTGAGAIQGYGPTAAAFVDMTPDKGSWTTTLSGIYSSNPSGTVKWERQGTQVTIWVDASITATSNSAGTIAASGLPAAITPSSNRLVACGALSNGGASNQAGMVFVLSSGTLQIDVASTSGSNIIFGGFANAVTAGLFAGWSITYSL